MQGFVFLRSSAVWISSPLPLAAYCAAGLGKGDFWSDGPTHGASLVHFVRSYQTGHDNHDSSHAVFKKVPSVTRTVSVTRLGLPFGSHQVLRRLWRRLHLRRRHQGTAVQLVRVEG